MPPYHTAAGLRRNFVPCRQHATLSSQKYYWHQYTKQGFTLKQLEEKIEYYRGRDGDFSPLLSFLYAHISKLAPDFKPSIHEMSNDVDVRVGTSSRLTFRWGSDGKGYEATHLVGPVPSIRRFPAKDEIKVRPFGLPEGIQFELDSFRETPKPRYITLRIAGPEKVVEDIRAAFVRTFEL